MPAAAVIPAPIAYIKVVAVKKLVVGFLAEPVGLRRKACVTAPCAGPLGDLCLTAVYFGGLAHPLVYCEKIRVFKAGILL